MTFDTYIIILEIRAEYMAKQMTELEKYYNKFNEDKRLLSRHGQVEYITSMKYIHEVLAEYLYSNSTIVGFLTIGAYSLYCYSQSLLAITLAITAIVAGAGIKSTVDFWAKKMSDKDNKDARIQKDD